MLISLSDFQSLQSGMYMTRGISTLKGSFEWSYTRYYVLNASNLLNIYVC